jgi:hypothetical protein
MSTLTDQIKAKCATIAQNQQLIYEKGKSEGGGGEPTTPTVVDGRTCLSYWYQSYGIEWEWGVYYDEENFSLAHHTPTPIDEISYPIGTENILNASAFSLIMYSGNEDGTITRGIGVRRFSGILNLPKALSAQMMFYNCDNLEDLGEINIPNVTDTTAMFYGCSNISNIDGVKFGRGTISKCSQMFAGCNALVEIPPLDLSNVTSLSTVFRGCHTISNVNNVIFGKNITSAPQLFNDCKSITAIPPLDLSAATNVNNIFQGCSLLQTVPDLDFRNVISASWITSQCPAIKHIRIKNLKTNTQIGSGTSYGHLINVDDLIFTIYHLRDTGSKKTFTIGSANLEKLANVYVKTIPITEAMRAEDDLIDEKLPFEVCESTDEGATLITDYVLGKNWTLK